MPEFENLLYETLDEGRLCRITLNRPEKMNALSGALYQELNEALHDAEGDLEVRVVILRGAGRTFSAGYDIGGLHTGTMQKATRSYPSRDEQGRPLAGSRTALQQITDVQMYFWNMAKATIAQVHGYAIAGGCELAMMADLVVAADDAQLGHPGCRGLGTPRNGCIWPLMIPMRHAKELIFTGDSITGKRAEELNMINKAVPVEELEDYTLTLARRLAIQDADSLAIHKHMLNRFHEHMGIYPSVRAANDYDVMYAYTGFGYKWHDAVENANREGGGGLKEALAWRDTPYQDYRMAKAT